MRKPAVAVSVITGFFLVGCAGPLHMDASFREALREQEAASARLFKALARYCSLASPSLQTQQQCIVEHRLLPFRTALDVPARSSASPAAAIPSMQLVGRTGPSLVTCQRLRSQTACRRADAPSVQFDGG